MLITYKLNFKSIHTKFLFIGVTSLLDDLKKKHSITNLSMGRLHKKTKKFTVLKSPFVYKSARTQLSLDTTELIIYFSIFSKNKSIYLDKFLQKKINELFISQSIATKIAISYNN